MKRSKIIEICIRVRITQVRYTSVSTSHIIVYISLYNARHTALVSIIVCVMLMLICVINFIIY